MRNDSATSRGESELQREQRRTLLKLMGLAGGVLSLGSFGPFISYLPRQFRVAAAERQRILLQRVEGRGQPKPAGAPFWVRVDRLDRLPPNSRGTFVYPRTGDPVRDSEPFKNWVLIRLPPELGGQDARPEGFRAYSQVCVHLWCAWDYKPHIWEEKPPVVFRGVPQAECSCHGSVYNALTGLAIGGPAAAQAPPANCLPQLTLGVDDEGFLVVEPADFSLTRNGVIGFGRFCTD